VFKLSTNSLAFANGHSDQLSYQSALILLGIPNQYQAVEIIYAVEAIFSQSCMFILTGAHYQGSTLNGRNIKQNTVYAAKKNDCLKFGQLLYGFRLYLIASELKAKQIGCYRDQFNVCFNLPHHKIRLIKGPEWHYLTNPKVFLDTPFVISSHSNLAGLRLTGAQIDAKQYDIISSIVDDGMIQLTANGAIVLLRERQVTGGYPRIFSVIKTDLDFLAQYTINAVVHFELIEPLQAKKLWLQREEQLKQLKILR
jgi:allophanate hydrolase subunit 2